MDASAKVSVSVELKAAEPRTTIIDRVHDA